MTDVYTTLAVQATVSDQELKVAYRKLARRYHPDVSAAHDAEERFKQIQAAWDLVRDPVRRQNYDRQRTTAPRPRPAARPRPQQRQHEQVEATLVLTVPKRLAQAIIQELDVTRQTYNFGYVCNPLNQSWRKIEFELTLDGERWLIEGLTAEIRNTCRLNGINIY